LAFADDIAFIIHSTKELDEVIGKLLMMTPHLSLNLSKCGIIPLGKHNLANQPEYQQIPVSRSYKYLGVYISTTTKETLTTAKNGLKFYCSQITPNIKSLPPEASLRAM